MTLKYQQMKRDRYFSIKIILSEILLFYFYFNSLQEIQQQIAVKILKGTSAMSTTFQRKNFSEKLLMNREKLPSVLSMVVIVK